MINDKVSVGGTETQIGSEIRVKRIPDSSTTIKYQCRRK